MSKTRKRRKRTNSQVPAKGRLREQADQLWSYAVRDDWGWRCAVCGATNCEAHHLVPRQFEATRYLLRNGVSLCPAHHKFDPDISPHLNAAAFLEWLGSKHPELCDWYWENCRPQFHGIKNAQHYIEHIQEVRQYVPAEEFDRIVGVRFSQWLAEQSE